MLSGKSEKQATSEFFCLKTQKNAAIKARFCNLKQGRSELGYIKKRGLIYLQTSVLISYIQHQYFACRVTQPLLLGHLMKFYYDSVKCCSKSFLWILVQSCNLQANSLKDISIYVAKDPFAFNLGSLNWNRLL